MKSKEGLGHCRDLLHSKVMQVVVVCISLFRGCLQESWVQGHLTHYEVLWEIILSIAEDQKEPFLATVSMHDLGKMTSMLTEFGYTATLLCVSGNSWMDTNIKNK